MYTVTATKQGVPFATLNLPAPTALAAIEAAEQALKLKVREYHISEGENKTREVNWTGVEFTARRIQ